MLELAHDAADISAGAPTSAPPSGVRLKDGRDRSVCYTGPVAPERTPDPLASLAAEARTGDAAAVRRLLDAVAPSMLGVARAVLGGGDRDLEDVLQDALVGLVQGLASFRGESSVLHFARSIALRRALDQRRRRARRGPEVALVAELGGDDDTSASRARQGELEATGRSPAASVVATRRRDAFRGLLAELPPDQAEALAQREPLAFARTDLSPRGAAIECRVYAEDPSSGFLPSPGRIERLVTPAGPGVRDDGGVYAGGEVSSFYDPLVSKLCVWAPTRERAVARMRRALREYIVTGIRTNLAFHEKLFSHPDFIAGEYDTGFIDRYEDELLGYPRVRETDRAAVALAIVASRMERATGASAAAAGESGSRLSRWVAHHRARTLRD